MDVSNGHCPAGAARPGLVIGNEFAAVSVGVDLDGNSPRLRLADLRTGRTRCLDALELETIVWVTAETMARLHDPAADRWRDEVA